MMTKEEYMGLSKVIYQELQELKSKPSLYGYEKSLVDIWQDLGRQILEISLSKVLKDRRKKT
jgi:hypothetical protein